MKYDCSNPNKCIYKTLRGKCNHSRMNRTGKNEYEKFCSHQVNGLSMTLPEKPKLQAGDILVEVNSSNNPYQIAKGWDCWGNEVESDIDLSGYKGEK